MSAVDQFLFAKRFLLLQKCYTQQKSTTTKQFQQLLAKIKLISQRIPASIVRYVDKEPYTMQQIIEHLQEPTPDLRKIALIMKLNFPTGNLETKALTELEELAQRADFYSIYYSDQIGRAHV